MVHALSSFANFSQTGSGRSDESDEHGLEGGDASRPKPMLLWESASLPNRPDPIGTPTVDLKETPDGKP
jgi:hypothetical protein